MLTASAFISCFLHGMGQEGQVMRLFMVQHFCECALNSTNVEHMQMKQVARVQYCAGYVSTTLVLLEISNTACAKAIIK